jgi:hypothetical protein
MWRAVLPKYVLDPLELITLEQAARLSDVIAALDRAVVEQGPLSSGSKGQTVPHPAIGAAAACRRELGKLIRDLDLPDENEPAPQARRSRSQQSRAAESRWAAQRRLRGDGRGSTG